MAALHTYCPRCGQLLEPKLDGGRERPACVTPDCGYIDFGSFSIGAAGVVVRDGKALLVQRGWEPGKGSWQIPGGYVEHDEPIIPAVEREAFEEAGIVAKVRDVIAFRHSVAGAARTASTNIYMVFRLDETELRDPVFDNDEITGAGFFSLDEMANMERVQGISIWAIQKGLIAPAVVGLHPVLNDIPNMGAGFSMFGVRLE
jgi:ADP-ribose pyrophosphatase YjhB (NUDIX family)